jgi:hypothetical protein
LDGAYIGLNIIGGYNLGCTLPYNNNFFDVNVTGTATDLMPSGAYKWGPQVSRGPDGLTIHTFQQLGCNLGLNAYNAKGISPAHWFDTSNISGYSNHIAEFRNNGSVMAGIDASGGLFTQGGGFNQGFLRLGNYSLWVSSAGELRIKNGLPTSDIDGVSVGSQT